MYSFYNLINYDIHNMSKLIEQFTAWVKILSKKLYLSLTSSDFYSDLYINHKGYGFKYLINLCILSSMIICGSLIVQINYQKQSLSSVSDLNNGINQSEGNNAVFAESKNDAVDAGGVNLNYLINQIPAMPYDGESITYDGEMPLYIKMPSGNTVAVIDLEGATFNRHKSFVAPVIFTKKLINISFVNLQGEAEVSVPLEYKKIFGSEARVIDRSVIRDVLSEYFDYAPNLIIYAFFPIFSLFLFGLTIFQNIAAIIMLLLVSFLFYKNVSWKGCVRLVVFSAASVTLLQSLAFVSIPELLNQKWILGLWVNFLVVVGLFRVLRSSDGCIARFKKNHPSL